ncbi:hypothetical protein PanWU01x14_210290 [Parasponia andersonii]|uniref:Uncharacterized protein n=1 Tax=Parasponia andersonii TaxID=3476 RepID=A0A2P5BU40_PARAD|nr:hypothetical protein PanWU01x14_210290 [Parasponia andersonii]
MLIFPSLIYRILYKQKPFMYDSEFLTVYSIQYTPSNIVFKLKKKDPVEGELEATTNIGTQGSTTAAITLSTDQDARVTKIKKMVIAIAKKLDVDMEDI